MTHAAASGRIWEEWGARWRSFQEAFVPERERQLAALGDYAALASDGRAELVLDLGSGPGAAADAVLRRCPAARAVAVDLDPWLTELGRRTATAAERIGWVQADLRDARWGQALPTGPYDAVVTAAALHWLSDAELGSVYAGAARLIAPRGILLVAESVPVAAPRLERLMRAAACGREAVEGASWNDFWLAARAVPEFAALLGERDRRRLTRPPMIGRTLDVHTAALAEGGFAEVAEVWRAGETAVIAALR